MKEKRPGLFKAFGVAFLLGKSVMRNHTLLKIFLSCSGIMLSARPVPAEARFVPLNPYSYYYDSEKHLYVGTLSIAVAHINPIQGDKTRPATGFFFENEGEIFLITNRHVVLYEPEKWKPDTIRITFHKNERDISEVSLYTLTLYGEDARPLWEEHPVLGKEADIVAIPLFGKEDTKGFLLSGFTKDNFVTEEDRVYVGEDVLILGFPLDYYDYHYKLPIFRKGIVASFYPVFFNTKPFFYVDARLHRGMSGAPVIFQPGKARSTVRGGIDSGTIGKIYLVGVNSERHDVQSRDPEIDEPLGLNVVIYSELILEIIKTE